MNRRPAPPGKPRRFTVLELQKATRGFSEAEALTTSSSGVLYRGTLRNRRRVAVKRWSSTQSLRYSSRVLKRIGELTRVDHPNLAAVRGWCCESNETIVVYDHNHYRSMDRWLFGVGSFPWKLRVRLIKDVAEALSYLHSEELAHGNLETSSVFLDANYRAVLGDYGFGFCEISSKERNMGKREDVFRFGILVLEIVAGEKKKKKKEEEEVEGVEWLDEQVREKGVLRFARTMYERGEMVKMVDERMGDCVNFEEAVQVLKMGLNCTAIEIDTRPHMEEVFHFFNMMQSLNYH